jgi:hypothetical protein
VDDLGETHNLAADRPEVVAALQRQADAIRRELGDKLRQQTGSAVRPAGVAEE